MHKIPLKMSLEMMAPKIDALVMFLIYKKFVDACIERKAYGSCTNTKIKIFHRFEKCFFLKFVDGLGESFNNAMPPHMLAFPST